MAMKSHGFTLIEVLVSVGIIAVVGVIMAQGFFSMIRTNVKTELIKEVKQNGDVALDIMSRMIRGAASVATACSASGTTTETLTIVNPDGNTTSFACSLDTNVARIASTSSTKTEYLTSRNVALGTDCTSAITFVCTNLPGQKTSIKINFKLGQLGSSVGQFEKTSGVFQATVTTRQ